MNRGTENIVSFRLVVDCDSEAPIDPVLGRPGQPKNIGKLMDDRQGRKSTRSALIVHWPPGAIATSNRP
jgi:hypothetical protein